MSIINKYNKSLSSIEDDITKLKNKREELIKEILDTNIFKEELIKYAIENPVEAFRFIFVKDVNYGQIMRISQNIYYEIDYKRLKNIPCKYAKVIIEAFFNCFKYSNYNINENSFLNKIKIFDTMIWLLDVETDMDDYEAYHCVSLTKAGSKSREILLDHIIKNGIDSIIKNDNVNELIYSVSDFIALEEETFRMYYDENIKFSYLSLNNPMLLMDSLSTFLKDVPL